MAKALYVELGVSVLVEEGSEGSFLLKMRHVEVAEAKQYSAVLSRSFQVGELETSTLTLGDIVKLKQNVPRATKVEGEALQAIMKQNDGDEADKYEVFFVNGVKASCAGTLAEIFSGHRCRELKDLIVTSLGLNGKLFVNENAHGLRVKIFKDAMFDGLCYCCFCGFSARMFFYFPMQTLKSHFSMQRGTTRW